MNKQIIVTIAVVVIVGGGAFYGGMKYQQSKNPMSGLSRQNFQNLSEKQRQQLQANAGAAFQGETNRANGQSFLTGKIIAKDAQSLTLEIQDGGSKIVFYSETTTIDKFTSGSLADLEAGKSVTVNGKANSDGSLTAESIQIRPAGTNLPSR